MKFKIIILNQIVTLLLVGLLFFSTSGFIIHKHNCSENNETKLVIFSEITDMNKSCLCCEHNTKNSIIAIKENVIKKSDCCCNINYFIKIFETITVLSCFKELSVVFIKYINTYSLGTYFNQLNFIKTISYSSPPVLFTGKSLIHFIHNIKIPFPKM